MSISILGIDSTVDSLTAPYDYTQQVDKTAKTTVVEQTEKTATENSDTEVKILNKYDRVEISTQAYQNYQRANESSDVLSTMAGTANQSASEDSISQIQSTLTVTETDEDSLDLTKLTEQELKALVSEGTITQAEANAELLRRAREEKAAEEASEARRSQEKETTADQAPETGNEAMITE